MLISIKSRFWSLFLRFLRFRVLLPAFFSLWDRKKCQIVVLSLSARQTEFRCVTYEEQGQLWFIPIFQWRVTHYNTIIFWRTTRYRILRLTLLAIFISPYCFWYETVEPFISWPLEITLCWIMKVEVFLWGCKFLLVVAIALRISLLSKSLMIKPYSHTL